MSAQFPAREVVLDTHALVWWVSDSDRLSATARARISAADDVVVSTASAWEIALLCDAGRIALDRPVRTWVHDATRQLPLRPVPIDIEIALAAVALGVRGFHRDPADRFIYATAQLRRAPLVTKDAAIHTFAAHDAAVTALW